MIMMKRMLIVGALMALLASSAMAATLVKVDPVGTMLTSQITAITNDGVWAAGYDAGGTTDRAFVYKVSDASVITNIVAGSYMAEGHGIGYRTVSGVQQLVLGGKQSSAQLGMFTSSDNGATWTRPYATSGSAPGSAFSNAVGGSGANDTAWMLWAEGTSSYSVTRIYGDPTVAGTATKSSTQSVYVQGVSDTGRGACARKDASGTKQNVYLDFTTDGGTAAQNFFAGLDGTNHGIASQVSGDGTAIFGQSPIVGSGTTNYPYVKVVGGAITALPLLPGTAGSVSLGYIYGASEDGFYAVGMDYTGMERAAIWTSSGVTDLTTLATNLGILGGFTGNLRRAYTIGEDGSGNLVIGGMGVWYDVGSTVALTRGFLLTIAPADLPEPATLSFLALGGLALLRRRR
jgi:hypothetical protein